MELAERNEGIRARLHGCLTTTDFLVRRRCMKTFFSGFSDLTVYMMKLSLASFAEGSKIVVAYAFWPADSLGTALETLGLLRRGGPYNRWIIEGYFICLIGTLFSAATASAHLLNMLLTRRNMVARGGQLTLISSSRFVQRAAPKVPQVRLALVLIDNFGDGEGRGEAVCMAFHVYFRREPASDLTPDVIQKAWMSLIAWLDEIDLVELGPDAIDTIVPASVTDGGASLETRALVLLFMVAASKEEGVVEDAIAEALGDADQLNDAVGTSMQPAAAASSSGAPSL
jgi:hypothetical protein